MTDAEGSLRAVSDELLSELDRLAAIESEKRTLEPGDDRTLELARQARQLAQRILATSLAQEHLVEGGHAAVQAELPGAPTHTIEETPRALFKILDDWREAERQASAATDIAQRADARARADQFREEYRRAFDETLRQSEGGK
jgi:hypothetical protein